MDADHLAGRPHNEIVTELERLKMPIIWADAARYALPSLERMRNDTVLIISLIIDDLRMSGQYVVDSVADYMNLERDTIDIPSVHVLKIIFNFPDRSWQVKMMECGEMVGIALQEILE
jgi:hypothetical protein